MIEKIILYTTIIGFVIFIISMARINEHVTKKYPKLIKKFYKDLQIPILNAIFFPLKLFFSDLDKKDKILKKWLIIYRISFLLFLILAISYIVMTR